MGNEFISSSEPVTVTTFGDTENIYWLIMRGERTFLRTTSRAYLKKSWTQSLAKALLFNTEQDAVSFAKEKFSNIKIEQ